MNIKAKKHFEDRSGVVARTLKFANHGQCSNLWVLYNRSQTDITSSKLYRKMAIVGPLSDDRSNSDSSTYA